MAFTRINQTFAFHSSPEAFISNRIQQLSLSNPEAISSTSGTTKITQASILNRSVHIISSYEQCKAILECCDLNPPASITSSDPKLDVGSDTFAVGPAYKDLMSEFFPPPNILLEDGLTHYEHKERWKQQISTLPEDTEILTRKITRLFVREHFVLDTTLDIYETVKTLSWRLLIGTFLGLEAEKDRRFYEIEDSQETLLRGQFSLFPLAINTALWQSPRSKGLKARRDLQAAFTIHVHKQIPQQCPILKGDAVNKGDIASHSLLFTSSIANKALTSLITASIMNIFLKPGKHSLAQLLRSQDSDQQKRLLRSIVLESARLSPPVVGVMRRVQHDVELRAGNGKADEDHHISKGHDAWLYFVGANRDEAVFEDAGSFQFDRFMYEEAMPSLAFGAGPKACLGAVVALQMVFVVIEELLGAGLDLRGKVDAPGVRAWLGWEPIADPQIFAKDLKQLPCQRPRDPVMVTVRTMEEAS